VESDILLAAPSDISEKKHITIRIPTFPK
jgi:hypothetical protein